MLRSYLSCLLLFLLPVTAFAQFTNVMISSSNTPAEPCIAINPKNPAQIVAGANLNNVYYSSDTGKVWQEYLLSSTYGVWGDPCIVTDTAGSFYFFHLSAPSGFPQAPDWIDRIVCQRMDSFNQNWTNGTYTGLNGQKDQDKEWVAVDPQTNMMYMTWTEFDLYGSQAATDSSRILFSRSADRGDTWSTPLRLNQVSGDCIDEDNTVEGAVPTVGPNGELYVSWTGPAGIRFDRSLDQGQSWLTNDILVDQTTGWDYQVPGLNRCNGLPFISCDRSGGPHHGTIYINWSDQRNGTGNTDIFLSRSTDGGNTWSPAVMVNNDTGVIAHQFLSSLAVDQSTGYIYILFYDRRNYNDNRTDVYLAWSTDGGLSFRNRKISQSPFTPFFSLFFGDYTWIAVQGDIIRPIWGRMDGAFRSIMTAIVDTAGLFSAPAYATDVKLETETVYPNPFQETTFLSFKLRDKASVQLDVADIYGRRVATLIDNERLPLGKYTYQFDPSEQDLPAGIYFFRLLCDGKVTTRKIIYSQ